VSREIFISCSPRAHLSSIHLNKIITGAHATHHSGKLQTTSQYYLLETGGGKRDRPGRMKKR
jgi:hypothetical protein